MSAITRTGAVSPYDHRPFFERALAHGLRTGTISPERLATLNQEAPKGMVQIAKYFGTPWLRPELELARERLVRLVSLYLEHSCHGDLQRAAESLRDHSLLSRSKGGSDMLKALIALPPSTHFALAGEHSFTDADKPLLARWIQRPLADYLAQWTLRHGNALKMEAARWWADAWELDPAELHETDAEAVIRTALLMHAARRRKAPNRVEFENGVLRLRERYPQAADSPSALPGVTVPVRLPRHLHDAVLTLCESVQDDCRQLLDASRPLSRLLHGNPRFVGRYFWRHDPQGEWDHAAQATNAAWCKATGGHDDEASLLTLFLCLAAGQSPKTVLTPAGATRLLRRMRQLGWQPEHAHNYIMENAPHPHQGAYRKLWKSFVQESQAVLLDDHDHTLRDAQALLRRECNVMGG